MIKKFFDGLAIVSAIVFIICAMALDSASVVPFALCAGCGAYLFCYIEALIKFAEGK